MFSAVCDKCGKSCEVPFKPSGGKPIFCSDCFGQNRGSGSQASGPSKEQFDLINSKLDKILKALNPAVKEVAEIKSNKEISVLAEKKAVPKKAAKKKAVAVVSGEAKKKKK
jgi:CxxC-x17-CxxC domain-containing protein